jgi:hypothetical protein
LSKEIYNKYKQQSSKKWNFSKGYTGKGLKEAIIYWLVIQKILEYHGKELRIILDKKYQNYEENGKRHMMMEEATKLFIKENREYLED